MPDDLAHMRAYLFPSGALCYGQVAPIGSDEERAWRRRFYAWAGTPEGAAWVRSAAEERDARRAGALAALTRECSLPSPTFDAVLAEARTRAAQAEAA